MTLSAATSASTTASASTNADLADAAPSTAARVGRAVLTTLIAGAVGLVLWELWIRFGAPVATGKFPLDGPIGLAQASLNALFGINQFKGDALLLGLFSGRDIAEIAHFGAAFIGYPLGYLLVARPLARAIAPVFPWWIVGLAYGAALFVFAGYVMAHLVVGWPAFFGWSSITSWTGLPPGSFIGHVLLGLGIAIGARLRGVA